MRHPQDPPVAEKRARWGTRKSKSARCKGGNGDAFTRREFLAPLGMTSSRGMRHPHRSAAADACAKKAKKSKVARSRRRRVRKEEYLSKTHLSPKSAPDGAPGKAKGGATKAGTAMRITQREIPPATAGRRRPPIRQAVSLGMTTISLMGAGEEHRSAAAGCLCHEGKETKRTAREILHCVQDDDVGRTRKRGTRKRESKTPT